MAPINQDQGTRFVMRDGPFAKSFGFGVLGHPPVGRSTQWLPNGIVPVTFGLGTLRLDGRASYARSLFLPACLPTVSAY